MAHFIVGVLLILHGAVHLLYLGHSAGMFELQSGLAWPTDSWLLERWMSDSAIKMTVNVICALAAMLFALAGIGRLLDSSWWAQVTILAVAVSTAMFHVSWDGSGQRLSEQGGIAILINIALLIIAMTM